ncbi:MAG: site-specific integrase [Carboxylicivirga sp.]|jgi:integrase|nr:site-specific integrase [Carboxylicivirga sp.]
MNLNYYIRNEVITARLKHLAVDIRISTGIKLKSQYWNKHTQQIKNIASIVNRVDINRFLIETKERFERMYLAEKPHTKQGVKLLIKKALNDEKEEKIDLITFASNYVELQKKKINPKTGKPVARSTVSKYRLLHRNLLAFSNRQKQPLDFDDINLEFYYEYTNFLKEENKYSPNTLGKSIQALKALMNEAIQQGLTTNTAFKSSHFKKIAVDVENIYLNDLEVRQILSLDLSLKPKLERIRDVFIVGCYTGLRYSDIVNIKKSNVAGNYMNIIQEKTGDRVTVPLSSQVLKILEKYNYHLKRNAKMNVLIKEVCRMAGLTEKVRRKSYKDGVLVDQVYSKCDLVSSHTARRSFATNSYQKGIPTPSIMKITGHRTEKSFYKYIKLDNKEHADLFLKAWGDKSILHAK